MEAQLTPAVSYPAQTFAQSFFDEIPVDSRYISNSYMKFPPSSTIDSKKIDFVLARFEANNLYLINEACIEVSCVILKEDGKLPDTVSMSKIFMTIFSTTRGGVRSM